MAGRSILLNGMGGTGTKSHPENERHEKKHTKNEDKEENKTPELSRIIQKTAKKQ